MNIKFYFQIYDRTKDLILRTMQGSLQASYLIGLPKEPDLIQGPGSIKDLPVILKKDNIHNVLIITDNLILKNHMADDLFESLNDNNINYTVYDKIKEIPTVENIEQASILFKDNSCIGIIGFGSASIDCAKVVAVNVGRGLKDLSDLFNRSKVSFPTPVKLPAVIAVPTTAGNTSEANISAVIYDNVNNASLLITDISLRPKYTVLDPKLTVEMPAYITVISGMDALTRAIEAYISPVFMPVEKNYAKMAVRMIFDNLEYAVKNGQDLACRNKMLYASYYAGLACAQGLNGYNYPMGHHIGEMYNIPNGYVNAICMPYVLNWYGSSVYKSLAELADEIGISEKDQNNKEKAIAFINELKLINKKFHIPENIIDMKDDHIQIIAKKVLKDAHPFYPVPENMKYIDCMNILKDIKD